LQDKMISDINKISINGSSGFVGKYLKSSLMKNGFNVASLKSVLDFKQIVDYESYLLESLKNTQTIIILGWDTRNRRLDAQIDSMLQTIALLLILTRNQKLRFLTWIHSNLYLIR
jgi:hypothetical protein